MSLRPEHELEALDLVQALVLLPREPGLVAAARLPFQRAWTGPRG